MSARIEPAPHFECRELGVVVNQAGDQSARLRRFLEADLMTGHCTRKHCAELSVFKSDCRILMVSQGQWDND